MFADDCAAPDELAMEGRRRTPGLTDAQYFDWLARVRQAGARLELTPGSIVAHFDHAIEKSRSAPPPDVASAHIGMVGSDVLAKLAELCERLGMSPDMVLRMALRALEVELDKGGAKRRPKPARLVGAERAEALAEMGPET
ncbi:MAG TPA: hypothetical protein VGI10_12510 [Polyangiaceae bacterium]|jgi:hypothetical protein